MILKGTLLAVVLASTVVAGAQRGTSADQVFLSPRALPGTCPESDADPFRNRTYTFLASRRRGETIALHDGKAVERDDIGHVDWQLELVAEDRVTLGNRSAVLLEFFDDHLAGSGSVTTFLVVTCDSGRWQVVLEAAGEGLRRAFGPAVGEITLTRAIWSPADAHCCPSGEIEERYRWIRDRFIRVG